MIHFELLSELDSVLTQAEISAEKCRHMAYQAYDSMSECKEDYQKLYYYNQNCLLSDIAHDYAVKVDKELKETRKLVAMLFEKYREKETAS